MDPSREQIWSEHERVYLLAEVLKSHPLPSQEFVRIIQNYNIQPRWEDMALPHGRTLGSCQRAFDQLLGRYASVSFHQPPPPLQSPLQMPTTQIPRKRAFGQDTLNTPTGRLLQPRPPLTYPASDVNVGGPVYSSMSPTEPAQKKKRGRPTKAEAQARQEAAAARGQIYPPPRPREKGTSVSSGEGTGGEGPLSAGHPRLTPLGTSPTAGSSQPPLREGAPSGSVQGSYGPPRAPESEQRRPAAPSGMSSATQAGAEVPVDPNLRQPQPSQQSQQLQQPQHPPPPPQAHHFGSTAPPQPPSAPRSPYESRDRDVRMEGVEEAQHRTATPHSFKDTVGIE